MWNSDGEEIVAAFDVVLDLQHLVMQGVYFKGMAQENPNTWKELYHTEAK